MSTYFKIHAKNSKCLYRDMSAYSLAENKHHTLRQRRLDPGKETLKGFFQVRNNKEYQNVEIISFVHLEKINIFCFMHKGVAQKLSLPRPLEN